MLSRLRLTLRQQAVQGWSWRLLMPRSNKAVNISTLAPYSKAVK
jgi:hypothetical protein